MCSHSGYSYVTGKVTSLYFTKYHVMKTYGSGGIAPHVTPWRYMEVSGQLHAPATLPPE
jgi:hypothetical protein